MGQSTVVFDEAYYKNIMGQFGYDPLKFGRINFSLNTLDEQNLQLRWLCHHDANVFAQGVDRKERSIVTTGFGMSGVPHAGTISEILRSVVMQKAGLPVQLVLGDLDAYNGKGKSLAEVLELTKKYRNFVAKLGFDANPPSILRAQYDQLEVLRTAYLIGHYMEDKMFDAAEEDLHGFYSARGKVDEAMSYRRKLSLNLMIGDFIHLHTVGGFKNILVMLGIDEHKYVRFGQETIRRIKESPANDGFNPHLSAIYSQMNKGFKGFPKMSKSFPESSIRADMSRDEIYSRIMEEPQSMRPEEDIVYQLMASASYYPQDELAKKYLAFGQKGNEWNRAKKDYAEMLIEICAKWKD